MAAFLGTGGGEKGFVAALVGTDGSIKSGLGFDLAGTGGKA